MNSPFENQPLQQDSPFKASGRFGRLSYAAWTFLFSLVIGIAVVIIAFTFGFTSSQELTGLSTAGMIVIAILYIVCLYVSFVFTIRRLHDRNNTGWLSLMMLIPAVNLIFMIYLFAAKGTEGNNDYGPQRWCNKHHSNRNPARKACLTLRRNSPSTLPTLLWI